MNLAEAKHLIARSSFSSIADYLNGRLRYEVQMVREPRGDAARRGASRLGGRPDLPREAAWPIGPDGAPLAFLGKFGLADVAATGHTDGLLPPSGWLYVFYDAVKQPWGFYASEYESWRIIYADVGLSALRKVAPPTQLPDPCRFEACPVSFNSRVSLPSSSWISDEPPAAPRAHGRGRTMLADIEAYEQEFAPLLAPLNDSEPDHHLLGHAREIQGSMIGGFPNIYESSVKRRPVRPVRNPFTGEMMTSKPKAAEVVLDAVARLLRDSTDWELLLQIDSDRDGPGWMWGDMGRLYFWMPRRDQQARNFDNVWLQVQCC